MTNSKNTGRALLTSVMALVLCFAMLTGTTFAWFTDTETSSGNKIVAGNLDVQLLMFDGTNYVDIGSENKPIFGAASLIAQDKNADTLWEPGKTQIAYLAIRNAGNLALKYNVIVDVTDNGLIGALEYAIVPVQGGTADATTLEQSNWANIKDNYENGILAAGKTIAAPDGCLDEIKDGVQNETDFFALVIHMDENAGNEYKEKNVVIDITVNATQVEAEADSFGTDYDEGLAIANAVTKAAPEVNDDNTTKADETIGNLTDDKMTATVPAGTKLEEGVEELKLVKVADEKHANVIIGDGEYAVAYDIDIEGVADDNDKPITVTIKEALTKGLTNVSAFHEGVAMSASEFSYDAATGDITITVTHFSNFTLTTADEIIVAVPNADTLIEKLENSEDVILGANIKIDPASMSNAYGTTGINIKNGQTLDGNGYTLDIKGAGGTWDSGINTTGGLIKNIKVTGSFRGIFINHNSTHSEQVVLENVIIDGTTYTISCDQGMNQTLKATKSTFNGWTSYAATLGSAKFINCNFGEGNGYAYCRPYAPTTFTGCVFEEGYQMDAQAAVTFENCYIGETLITAENLATLVTSNTSNASVK